MHPSPKNTSHRLFEYDFIRAVAILAVIMIHCSAEYVIRFSPCSLQFNLGNLLNTTSRLAIPCFVMLSGRFMLDENRVETADKIAKKVLKLFFILLSWSLFYAICFSSESFWPALFYGHYHLWYLFVTIGLYLVTPLLRLFVKKENKAYIYYFLLLAVLFRYIPSFLDVVFRTQIQGTFARCASAFSIDIVSGYLPLYLLGWLVGQDLEHLKKHTAAICTITIVSTAIMIVGTTFYSSPTFKSYRFFYSEKNLPAFVYGASMFVLLNIFAQKFSVKLSSKIRNLIILLSKLSLGIYLIHIAILLKVIDLVRCCYGLTYDNCTPIIYIPLIYIPTLVLSALITYAMSKIKHLSVFIKM